VHVLSFLYETTKSSSTFSLYQSLKILFMMIYSASTRN